MVIQRAYSFIQRDFFIALSYRLKFIVQVAGIFVSTMLFFFLSKLVGPGAEKQLASYGGDYFAFVLIGVAFTDYLFVSVNSFAEEIRRSQMLGTLEALLVTPVSSIGILFYSSLYNILFTTCRVLLYLIFGVFVFHLELQISSLASFFILLAVTLVAFGGIGLLSAAFVVVFKQNSPVGWIVGTLFGVLGGVMFPIDVLPGWLENIARLLPITYSLEGMRQILLNGASLSDIQAQFFILLAFAVFFQGTGAVAFRYGLFLAKKNGSLLHY